MKLAPKSLNKKQKIYLTGIVIVAVIIIGIGYAYYTGAFLCSLTSSVYAGQAVDNEQAVAKLAAFVGSLERNNSPPLSYMAFNESRVQNSEIRAWRSGEQVTVRGYVFDAPYRDGDKLRYGDGYFLSGDGYLHKLSSPRC